MLPAAARPRTLMRLRLVLTKFGAPPVRIGWTLGIGRNAVTSRTQ